MFFFDVEIVESEVQFGVRGQESVVPELVGQLELHPLESLDHLLGHQVV